MMARVAVKSSDKAWCRGLILTSWSVYWPVLRQQMPLVQVKERQQERNKNARRNNTQREIKGKVLSCIPGWLYFRCA